MVTGDRPEVADTVGAVIGVDEVLAERAPTRSSTPCAPNAAGRPPSWSATASTTPPPWPSPTSGWPSGARGATASSEAADVVVTADRLDRVGEARALAHRSRRIALQSVIAGMAMSLAAMGLAAAGLLPAVWGALLQEGIDVVVILNALRALAPAPVHSAPRRGRRRPDPTLPGRAPRPSGPTSTAYGPPPTTWAASTRPRPSPRSARCTGCSPKRSNPTNRPNKKSSTRPWTASSAAPTPPGP